MKRILFVDDEPNILDGLRRMLRSQRRAWEMAFVRSGEEALKSMAASPFDVVVSDLRMPGMNGVALLSHLQEHYPRTVRIILSGHADLEASMRSVDVAHQFLTKPCEAEVLKRVVERACNLEVLLSSTTLQDILGGIGELPVLPKVYRTLAEALAEPEVDLRRIGQIVEQDYAIAAKVLQLVNSSFFGLRKEITNLRQATTYLGVDTIQALVLSFEIFREFKNTQAAGFVAEREQGHSFLTARIARRLVDEKNVSDQAFLAAMLHDIGKLLMATYLPGEFQKAVQASIAAAQPCHLAEESLLGVSHAEIGAYLLGLWGMPYAVVEAVASHHHPARVDAQFGFGVLGAVHVADVLARRQREETACTLALDDAFVQSIGVADRLPVWKAIAAEEASGGQEAA
jgi:putative nucleotidyltransferase with HDIG domain